MNGTRSALGASETERTLLRRWLDAFIEARMRKAERETGERLKSVSDEVLHRAGYRRRERS